MLARAALGRLNAQLSDAIASMRIDHATIGRPDLVAAPVEESKRLFQGHAKAQPRGEDAYAAARAFLKGSVLDSWQKDIVASALAMPVKELAGAMALGSKRLPDLLKGYESEANRGDLWRLTWYGLLCSYFSFDPDAVKDSASRTGWQSVREFLERTWPLIDRQAGKSMVPDWIAVLRRETAILTAQPVDRYALGYLRGENEPVERLASELGIPTSSWFWHALVLAAVRRATDSPDAEFRRLVPQLLKLIQGKPGFRDEALEAILIRYHACRPAPADERLQAFVCDAKVWKNPKLRNAGIATAWNRVPEAVWRMVLGWVNERNLKDFFDVLAARDNADEGRLAFWSQYLEQIEWTRLVFGHDTLRLKSTNAGVRDLIAREEGSYARLTAHVEHDAFMMQLGNHLIVEFSKKGKACYVYKADELPFDPYAASYDGGTDDLAAGFRGKCALRIVHRPGWEGRAGPGLADLGIRPDRTTGAPSPSASNRSSNSGGTERGTAAHTTGARAATASQRNAVAGTRATSRTQPPAIPALAALLGKYPGSAIDDRRSTHGGRLWVEDPQRRRSLEDELTRLGFRPATKRGGWYFPED